MNAAKILETVRAAGASVRLVGDGLAVKAATPDAIEFLRRHKAEIVTHLQSVERFLAAVQTIWPEARLLTDAEQAEDKQFREQITLVREPGTKALK
jgi:prefoldin subunit 5